MKITIEGYSQAFDYSGLATYIRHFNLEKLIDININGLKYKGRITKITYEGNSHSTWRMTTIQCITVEEEIQQLYIGDKT